MGVKYVKGGELFAKVVKGKMKDDISRKCFQQLISAVDFCHDRDVTHHDLKSEEILLTLCDTSAYVAPKVLKKKGYDGSKACDTSAYVAPKVLKKKGYDGSKANIWSSEVIFFALLSRYSIPDIMKDPRFQIGFMRPIAFSVKESVVEDNIDFNRDDVPNVNCNSNGGGNSNNNDDEEVIMVYHCWKLS
ncbi:hypothetical protein GYH30_033803 [Glycine max]|nr:hypothetical protein GYH30_033803 [Glycine max]